MTFANSRGGLNMYTDGFAIYGEDDLVKILFAENPAVVIQVEDDRKESVEKILDDAALRYFPVASPSADRVLMISHKDSVHMVNIDTMRRRWFTPSYLLDRLQSGEECARKRFDNFSRQPLRFRLPKGFKGSLASRGLEAVRKSRSGIRAAIIREKGVNINMLVFCGGFSNSDVLGSAKGWAGGFLWNDTAAATLRRYYDREDTLSLGVCNGCQLMIELNLLFGIGGERPVEMAHNRSHKFESQFVNMTVP